MVGIEPTLQAFGGPCAAITLHRYLLTHFVCGHIKQMGFQTIFAAPLTCTFSRV